MSGRQASPHHDSFLVSLPLMSCVRRLGKVASSASAGATSQRIVGVVGIVAVDRQHSNAAFTRRCGRVLPARIAEKAEVRALRFDEVAPTALAVGVEAANKAGRRRGSVHTTREPGASMRVGAKASVSSVLTVRPPS